MAEGRPRNAGSSILNELLIIEPPATAAAVQRIGIYVERLLKPLRLKHLTPGDLMDLLDRPDDSTPAGNAWDHLYSLRQDRKRVEYRLLQLDLLLVRDSRESLERSLASIRCAEAALSDQAPPLAMPGLSPR